MNYQALYRVWRPQQFADVVGQEHVTKTLQNALLQEKFTHAYLFSGPRGTGKTSAAKILAKAVNCERMPVSEPCNECAACRGITDGSISDVIEIDAASNNGVEEIRDIRDKAKYAPNAVPYKVYIIDEVHMLSIGAFNALLKTLEEPPGHVIFILATTEPHKIPLTIISRCQRFDFKRITSQDIVGRMAHIADESGMGYDEKALHVIARAAEGGMRDALSLLDQAASFSTDGLTMDDALAVTGSIAQTHLNELGRAIHGRNIAGALGTLDELMRQGKDPARLTEDLILFFRDLLLYRAAPNLEEALERALLDDGFTALAQEVRPDEIYSYIDILSRAQQEMKFSTHARIHLEVSLVKLCQTETAAEPSSIKGAEELFVKIAALEKQIEKLQARGPAAAEEAPKSIPAKKAARPGRSYKPNMRMIRDVLANATREDLNEIKGHWAALIETLNSRRMRSQSALLNDAEPAAASSGAFVLKFKYEIHCQMAMENPAFVEAISQIAEELTGRPLSFAGIPEEQWLEIREDFLQTQGQDGGGESKEQEDPLIAEAIKLVGADLIEYKE